MKLLLHLHLSTILFVALQTTALAHIDIQSMDGKAIPSNLSCDILNDGESLVKLEGQTKLARKSYPYICSGWLTIRSPKACIRLQCSQQQCRVHVIAGSVTIKNMLDHSIVKICSGSVYESTRTSSNKPSARFQDLTEAASICPLFSDKFAQTVLYEMLMDRHAQHREGIKAEIISPPTMTSYDIGDGVEHMIPLPPDLVQHFPPRGNMAVRRKVPALAGQLVDQ